MDPSSRYALNGLSTVLIEEKRYSVAISWLVNAPPDPGLLNNLAIAYSKNGNVDEAVAVLRKIIQAGAQLGPGARQPGLSLCATESLPGGG